ncbi:hypothetical protein M1E08_09505 [Erwinia sp. PK3-005]
MMDIQKLKSDIKAGYTLGLADAVMLREALAQLEKAEAQLAELGAIKVAAEKLIRCKGRYHAEQNYRALAALFGVTTPDITPPVDSTAFVDTTPQQVEALAGWKIVPVDPSKEMLSQIHPVVDGNCSHCGNRTTLDCEENMLLSWRDMLEAAPKPEDKC